MDRKKVNFMIDQETLKKLYQLIPAGKRSDFVNESLKEAIVLFSRKKASQEIDKLRDVLNLKLSTEEIIKLKNYGRK